jgi:DNA-binding transcriptional LysR family regulator
MFELLNHNEADIILTLDSHVYDKDYIIAKEESVGTHFVVNKDHPLASKKNLKLIDLLIYPFILTEKNMGYRRVLDEALSKHSLEIQPILEISRTDVITDLLQTNNQAISFLPDFVSTHKNLVYLDVVDFDADIWKQLIYHKNNDTGQNAPYFFYATLIIMLHSYYFEYSHIYYYSE